MLYRLENLVCMLATLLVHPIALGSPPAAGKLITRNEIGILRLGMLLPEIIPTSPHGQLSLVAVGAANYKGLQRGKWRYSDEEQGAIYFGCFCRVNPKGEWVSADISGAPKTKDETLISLLATTNKQYKTSHGVGVGNTLKEWGLAYPNYRPIIILRGTVWIGDSSLSREVACFSPAGSIKPVDKHSGNLISDEIPSKLKAGRDLDEASSPAYYILNVLPPTGKALAGNYRVDRDITTDFNSRAVVGQITVGRECRFDLGVEEFWE